MSHQSVVSLPWVLVRWGQPVTIEDVAAMALLLGEARAQQSQGLVHVSVIAEECKPPSAEVRRAILDEFSQKADAYEAVFLVVEGRGLAGAVLRTVIAGMLLFAGRWAARVSVVDSLDAVISTRRAAGDHNPEVLARIAQRVRPNRAD